MNARSAPVGLRGDRDSHPVTGRTGSTVQPGGGTRRLEPHCMVCVSGRR